MEIRPHDTYRIYVNKNISQDMLYTLCNLYQPMIGGDAILVYLNFLSDLNAQNIPKSFQDLFAVMNQLNADVMERAIIRLEEAMLMKTFHKHEGTISRFVFQLLAPMNVPDFFASNYFHTRYKNSVSQKVYEETLALCQMNTLTIQGYTEISHPIRLTDYQEEEVQPIALSPLPLLRYQDDASINFDYQRFLAITSPIIFPVELRTQENMYLIGKLATMYGLYPKDIKRALDRVINLREMTFNSEKLKTECAKLSHVDYNTDDKYALPPFSFLQSKMNGANISYPERKILEDLCVNHHFSNEVTNILIEHVLNRCHNQLNQNYLQKTAATWARENVSTKEQAYEQIRQERKNTGGITKGMVHLKMPEYYNQPLTPEELSGAPASQESLDKINEALKKMGNK